MPLTPLYIAAFNIHQAWLRATKGSFAPAIPMVVVGALRAGGSGKTSVTVELARLGAARGWNVAILAYRLRGGPQTLEIQENTDWRLCSEEAVMLRRLTGARVFATRNRRQAWKLLHDSETSGAQPFDLILSDDGFQDPRLQGAFRLLLTRPEEKPGLSDLLPVGSYRETWKARDRADMLLLGPNTGSMAPIGKDTADAGKTPGVPGMPGCGFRRTLLLPPDLDRKREWVAVCGLGDNPGFVEDLRGAGLRVVFALGARDHETVSPARLAACAARFPGAGFLCTRKDALKLDADTLERFPIQVVDQNVSVDARVMEALDAYRRRFVSAAAARSRQARRPGWGNGQAEKTGSVEEKGFSIW